MEKIRRPICGRKSKSWGVQIAGGLVLDSDDYEDKINHIAISHERTRRWNDALTEEEQSIFTIGIGEIDAGRANCATRRDLRRFGRGANVSRTQNDRGKWRKWRDFQNRRREFNESKENDFDHIHVFTKILQGVRMDVNKVNLLGKIGKSAQTKPILR